jgi:hypothetical protein
MELIEIIAAPVPGMEGCPLPHGQAQWPTYDNEFRGDGGELGDKMRAGNQTLINKEMGGGKTIQGTPDPTEDPDSEYQLLKQRPIKLGGLLQGEDELPLTCAAHHLIPAQASLKPSALVAYLYEGTAQFKRGKRIISVGGGKLIKNVGYDINGAQNGVWLPGPYALNAVSVSAPKPKGKKRGTVAALRAVKTSVSKAKFVKDTDVEDRPSSKVNLAPVPVGTRQIGPDKVEVSYYFLYTVAAMNLVASQYHDAHTKYNKFVLDCLNKIAVELHAFAYEGMCGQCPQRKESDKLPPPYRLTARLNAVSSRLRNYLWGGPMSWNERIFTSAMCLEYMDKRFRSLRLSDIEKL